MRCRASVSGNCLQMTEGWGHCDYGECEIGIMNEDWINTEKPGNGIGPVCKYCDRLIDWHPGDHAEDCPEYRDEERPPLPLWAKPHRRLDVSWDHNTEPPVPLVCIVEEWSDGYPGISIKDKDESLRMMWDEIQWLRGY